jgi:hypothetical protein
MFFKVTAQPTKNCLIWLTQDSYSRCQSGDSYVARYRMIQSYSTLIDLISKANVAVASASMARRATEEPSWKDKADAALGRLESAILDFEQIGTNFFTAEFQRLAEHE